MTLVPLQHDTAGRAVATVRRQRTGNTANASSCPASPRRRSSVVERDYPNTYRRFTALGPLADKLGNGGKGIAWNTEDEVKGLGELNRRVTRQRPDQGPAADRDRHRRGGSHSLPRAGDQRRGRGQGVGGAQQEDRPRPRASGREARRREDPLSRHRQAQPRKIISSPTWSGIESEHVSYNAGYTNVNELIPWRTLTGRQQFYQDHRWMRDFGEGFARLPPADRHPHGHADARQALQRREGDRPQLHHAASEMGHPLDLHRQPADADAVARRTDRVDVARTTRSKAGIVDNDWIEPFNVNGALAARAVVSPARAWRACA